MSDTTKQLKKNDFLAHVTEEPMTREQLVDALGDYEFISSYLDYLTDHFVRSGKVIRNGDGTFHRKAKTTAAPKELHRVIELDSESGDFALETKTLGAGELYDDAAKEAGWATTVNAAVKKASSKVFAEYKDQIARIKELTDSVAATAGQAKAA